MNNTAMQLFNRYHKFIFNNDEFIVANSYIMKQKEPNGTKCMFLYITIQANIFFSQGKDFICSQRVNDVGSKNI